MGGTLCSVVVPVAPKHLNTVSEAIASIQAQTVPCEIIVEVDHDQRGAAYTRNIGVQRASGLFLVFLDADDLLHPDYVESALTAYQRGGYVYSHWIEDGVKRDVEPCETWHPLRVYHYITTLIPRAMFDDCGGFDTTMPALEDADFFLRAKSRGWRALLDPSHKWEYRRKLGTSNTNPNASTAQARAVVLREADEIVKQRYGGLPQMCIDCSSPRQKAQNEHHDGDIQAFVLFTVHKVQGVVSGRLYRRPGSATEPLWVHPGDVAAMPKMFQAAPNVVDASPDIDTVKALAAAALATPAPSGGPVVNVMYSKPFDPPPTVKPKPETSHGTNKPTGRSTSRRRK